MKTILVIAVLLLAVTPSAGFSAAPPPFTLTTDGTMVTLAWNPNSEIDLAGYRVYYGNSSRTYGAMIDVGNRTTFQVPSLSPGVTYYFAVTAYNTTNMESGFSNEVFTTIDQPGVAITSMSASLQWFGVVLLATSSENASAVFRYKELVEGAKWSTVIATPTPFKTQHRVILYI